MVSTRSNRGLPGLSRRSHCGLSVTLTNEGPICDHRTHTILPGLALLGCWILQGIEGEVDDASHRRIPGSGWFDLRRWRRLLGPSAPATSGEYRQWSCRSNRIILRYGERQSTLGRRGWGRVTPMMALRPWTADFETYPIHSDSSGTRCRVRIDRLWPGRRLLATGGAPMTVLVNHLWGKDT